MYIYIYAIIFLCYNLFPKRVKPFNLSWKITIPRYFETPCLIYALLPLDLLRTVGLRKRCKNNEPSRNVSMGTQCPFLAAWVVVSGKSGKTDFRLKTRSA